MRFAFQYTLYLEPRRGQNNREAPIRAKKPDWPGRQASSGAGHRTPSSLRWRKAPPASWWSNRPSTGPRGGHASPRRAISSRNRKRCRHPGIPESGCGSARERL